MPKEAEYCRRTWSTAAPPLGGFLKGESAVYETCGISLCGSREPESGFERFFVMFLFSKVTG